MSGRYYSRIGGKFRALETDNFDVALARLAERKAHHTKAVSLNLAAENGVMTMGQLIASFRRATKEDPNIFESTKDAREVCLARLERTWPELHKLMPGEVTAKAIAEWAVRAQTAVSKAPNGSNRPPKAYDRTSLNKAAGVLSQVLKHGNQLGVVPFLPQIAKFKQDKLVPKRVAELPRTSVVPLLLEEIQFPRGENARIRKAVASLGADAQGKTQAELAEMLGISLASYKRHASGRSVGNGKAAADFVRLLLLTGARLEEAQELTWGDVNFQAGTIHLHGTKTPTSDRVNPMIPQLVEFLRSLPRGVANERIVQVKEVYRAVRGACARLSKKHPEVGQLKLTHHSFRHLFATYCFESGVDLETVARWLGHADGGTLARRVYNHVRPDHSAAQALKVRMPGT